MDTIINSCGGVVDVNKLLSAQRMRLKKQLIRSLENEIRSVSLYSSFNEQMESSLQIMYNENKKDVSRIGKGIEYLQSVPN